MFWYYEYMYSLLSHAEECPFIIISTCTWTTSSNYFASHGQRWTNALVELHFLTMFLCIIWNIFFVWFCWAEEKLNYSPLATERFSLCTLYSYCFFAAQFILFCVQPTHDNQLYGFRQHLRMFKCQVYNGLGGFVSWCCVFFQYFLYFFFSFHFISYHIKNESKRVDIKIAWCHSFFFIFISTREGSCQVELGENLTFHFTLSWFMRLFMFGEMLTMKRKISGRYKW